MIDPKELEPPVPQEEIDAAAAEQPAEEKPPVVEEKREDKKETLVPHQAMHEERERRKKLEQELQRERAQRAQETAVLNQRLGELYELQKPKAPPVPSYEEDPLANLHANVGEMSSKLQQALDAQKHEAAARNQQQFVSSVQAKFMQDEARFVKQQPDYQAAVQFLTQRRADELRAMGMPDQAIGQAIAKDVWGLALTSMQNGKSPAEAAYQFAVARGYVKKDEARGEQKMDALQKGVEASKTLGGGAPSGKPTLEQIAAMSDDDFAKYKAELKSRGQRISDSVQ
jgi:hypothetical protein